MDDYTLSQIKSMQQEATQRVREMNERSKSYLKRPLVEPEQSSKPYKQSEQKKQDDYDTHEKKNNSKDSSERKGGIKNLLGALDIKKIIGENSEQAILLLLILILLNDNSADDYLIYALLYIML